jgi:hypothetical protein
MTVEETQAFNNLAERVLAIENNVNENILSFNSHIAALVDMLEFSTDQRLDFQNLSAKYRKVMLEQFQQK